MARPQVPVTARGLGELLRSRHISPTASSRPSCQRWGLPALAIPGCSDVQRPDCQVTSVTAAEAVLAVVTARARRGERAGSVASVAADTEDPRRHAPERGLRIFLLDDPEIVRRGLRDLFESESDVEVVGESGSAAQAVPMLLALRPDVAILDARLLDGSGIDVCRSVRSRRPEIRALILTSYDDQAALFAAIMAGASGYLLKQIQGAELVTAVRRVAEGQSLLDPAVTSSVLERVRVSAARSGDLATLSDREHEILLLVAEGLTNRQIGERLYIAEKTAKNHVSNILGKLGVERRTQAVMLAARLAR